MLELIFSIIDIAPKNESLITKSPYASIFFILIWYILGFTALIYDLYQSIGFPCISVPTPQIAEINAAAGATSIIVELISK